MKSKRSLLRGWRANPSPGGRAMFRRRRAPVARVSLGACIGREGLTMKRGLLAPVVNKQCFSRSGRERRPAAAGAGCARILDHELRALEPFLVVDLGADQILVAHGVDQQRDAVLFHRRIVLFDGFVEGEAVLEAGTAAAG